ncbi:MAG: 23S rRNA (uracil(1939)-C(5))-methyltransferase RlmD [Endomicrobiia bacterium]
MNSLANSTTTNLVCKHFNICGGCEFQNIEYLQQLKNKQEFIKELFKEFDVKEIQPIIPSCQTIYYRNKMEFVVGKDKSNKIVSGLRQKGKFYKIVDLSECIISIPYLGEILNIVKEWIKENNVEPYDLITHKGKFRYIVLRHSKTIDQIMLNFVITGTKYQFEQNEQKMFLSLIDRLKKIQNLDSLYVSINNKISDNASAEEMFHLYGEKYITEILNGIKYLIYPTVFFQTNTKTAEVMYKIIQQEIIDGNVLDIYCGSGGITLQIFNNKNVDKIIGIDSSLDNIEIAKKNCVINDISEDKVEFVEDTAEVFLLKLWKSKFLSNLSNIIVDPPRPGLSKKVKYIISDLGVNRMIYISCNPEALKEDLKIFVKFYNIKKLIPIDMFPHTRHIEIVCVLDHK